MPENIIPFTGKITHNPLTEKEEVIKSLMKRFEENEIDGLMIVSFGADGDNEYLNFVGEINPKRALPSISMLDMLMREELFNSYILPSSFDDEELI